MLLSRSSQYYCLEKLDLKKTKQTNKKTSWKARIRTHNSRNIPIVGNMTTLIFLLSSIRCGFMVSILGCICLWKKKWMISLFLDLYSFYLFKATLAAIWQAYIWNSYHRLSSSLQFIKWLSVDVRVLIQNPEKSMEKFPFNLISSCLSSSYVWDSVVGNRQNQRLLKESWSLQVCQCPLTRGSLISGWGMVKSPPEREKEYCLMNEITNLLLYTLLPWLRSTYISAEKKCAHC